MLRLKLLLISLFTTMSLAGLLAQVTVHGTVTDVNGDPQENINILVSAIYSDSSAYFESVFTVADGTYEVEFPSPQLNMIGFVQVSMVDCFGNLITQNFTVANGVFDLQADFTYCEQIVIDSCAVFIIEEWVPGAINSLTAWTPFGPSNDYNYLWSTGETTETIFPQAPGEYCVTVTFPWGCSASDCYFYVIDSSALCFAYIASTLNNDGTYDLEAVSEGIPPFTYSWNTGDSTQFLNDVGPGTYCVTIIDSSNCINTACVFIDDFSFCEVWISSDPNGGLYAQGYGAPPLTYLWNTGETTDVIYPNQEGLYCVTITDQEQCTASSCYYYGSYQDSCYVYVTPLYIDSNTIALQAIPSTAAQSVSFIWSTGETGDIIYPQDPSLTYCVTMTDSDGCIATGCFEPLNYCYAWVDAQYLDTTTAVLSVYTDPINNWGGPGGTYLWSNGDTTETITVTASGEYCVTVSFGLNCVTEACVYVDFDSIQTQCSAWIFQYPDSTGQWFAEVFAWGFGDFTYLWTTGDTAPVIQLDYPNQFVCVTATSTFGCETEACIDTFFNPCKVYISVNYVQGIAILEAFNWNNPGQNADYIWSNGQTGPIITVNEEGTYCVTVTGGGCISESCVEVYFWPQDSCGVWITQQELPAGILYTAEAWGVPPFTYLWSNGSTEQSQIIDFGPPQLCVTVTDSAGCVSVACTQNGGEPFHEITGFVFGDTLVSISGFVYAYAMDPNGGVFQLTDSAQIIGGVYKFAGLPAGLYVLKAEIAPGTVGYNDYLPTYHFSSASWETADPVVVPNWLPVTKDIWMIRTDTTNGIGVIGGVITDPQDLIAGADVEIRGENGLPGVTILISDAQGNPFNYTKSLQDGSFRFTDLPLGTYRISYDIPGIQSPEIWVTLTQDDPEVLQVSLIVTQTATDVEEPVTEQVELYPNPAKESITIKLPLGNANYHFRIVDMQGRIIEAGSVENQNSIMHIDVEQYSPGLYHINLKGENSSYFGRFVKQE